ncbi:MAG TPA: MoxR family ATPase [Pseudonocardiaceae bacterium]
MNQAISTEVYQRIADGVQSVVRGKPELVRLAVTALLAEGHLLIEDLPGLGKTTLARCLARCIGGTFHRIQFTPDLLPGDITGVQIYRQNLEKFEFAPGGIFANVVLADEINRGTPKTQSALLESMEERQVTVDGTTFHLESPFMVVATQNPIEMEGTYRLPEAQLDRFLMRLAVGYPNQVAEVQVVMGDLAMVNPDELSQVVDLPTLQAAIGQVRKSHVDGAICEYAVRLAAATREHVAVRYGASPRGSVALVRAAQGFAATHGRAFVTPDDIKEIARSVLAHRLILRPDAELNQVRTADILDEVLAATPAPRTGASRV